MTGEAKEIRGAYLYLGSPDHADAWVNGGTVPLFPASRYRSTERAGVMTPDENSVLQLRTAVARPIARTLHLGDAGGSTHFLSKLPDGTVVPRVLDYGRYDGVVLCLTTRRDDEMWAARANKNACVAISELKQLFQLVWRQLESQRRFDGPRIEAIPCAEAEFCEYTDTAQRGPFLKSKEDCWQAEFRMIWYVASIESGESVEVVLPPGVGSLVWVNGSI